jgi:hypothetical protein
MKRVLTTMMLAAVLASLPVFAEGRVTAERNSGITAALFRAGAPAAPQYRRRYRRYRRYRIVRRRYRRRHYRRVYVMRHRRRRY